jgi:hypothetical protein
MEGPIRRDQHRPVLCAFAALRLRPVVSRRAKHHHPRPHRLCEQPLWVGFAMSLEITIPAFAVLLALIPVGLYRRNS